MASFKGLFLFLFAAAAVATNTIVVRAVTNFDFKVGDDEGWQTRKNNKDYFEHWAEKRGPFIVGDKLHFRYNNESDTVLSVDKEGYYHCHYDVVYGFYNDGNTTIKLVNYGPYYFVSNVSDHCGEGLRMLINVKKSRPQPPTVAPDPAPAPVTASSSVSNLAAASLLLVAQTAAFISIMVHALPLRL